MKLIELYPMAVHQATTTGLYPLHIALDNSQSECVVMKLIDLFPMAVKYVDDYYYYPLVLAIWNRQSENVILKLIELFPTAATVRVPNELRSERFTYYPQNVTNDGFVLHLACSLMESDAVIMKLIELYPVAAQEKDSL